MVSLVVLGSERLQPKRLGDELHRWNEARRDEARAALDDRQFVGSITSSRRRELTPKAFRHRVGELCGVARPGSRDEEVPRDLSSPLLGHMGDNGSNAVLLLDHLHVNARHGTWAPGGDVARGAAVENHPARSRLVERCAKARTPVGRVHRPSIRRDAICRSESPELG